MKLLKVDPHENLAGVFQPQPNILCAPQAIENLLSNSVTDVSGMGLELAGAPNHSRISKPKPSYSVHHKVISQVKNLFQGSICLVKETRFDLLHNKWCFRRTKRVDLIAPHYLVPMTQI